MIRKAVVNVVLNGLGLYAVIYMLDDVSYSGGLAFFVVGGIVVGLLNFIVKPILKAATFPLIFFTAGLFMVVINTLILWLSREIIDIIHYRDTVFIIEGLGTLSWRGFFWG